MTYPCSYDRHLIGKERSTLAFWLSALQDIWLRKRGRAVRSHMRTVTSELFAALSPRFVYIFAKKDVSSKG